MAQDKYAAILRILDDQNRLTDRADAKAISLLSALGLFTVLTISQLSNITSIKPATIVLLVIYGISIILAILHIILAISPRIRTIKVKKNEKIDKAYSTQLTFFKGICKYPDAKAYGKSLDELLCGDDSLSETYVRQVYEVAKINQIKYKYVGRAVWFVVITVISQIGLIVFLFSQKLGQF